MISYCVLISEDISEGVKNLKEGLKEKLAAGALAFGGACGIGTELSIVCQNNLAYAELLLLLCIYFFILHI